jgi:hypothetical protein
LEVTCVRWYFGKIITEPEDMDVNTARDIEEEQRRPISVVRFGTEVCNSAISPASAPPRSSSDGFVLSTTANMIHSGFARALSRETRKSSMELMFAGIQRISVPSAGCACAWKSSLATCEVTAFCRTHPEGVGMDPWDEGREFHDVVFERREV